jgi:hypothetical protein
MWSVSFRFFYQNFVTLPNMSLLSTHVIRLIGPRYTLGWFYLGRFFCFENVAVKLTTLMSQYYSSE